MKQFQAFLWRGAIFLTLLGSCFISSVGASEICKQWVGKVVSVQGTVQTRRADQTLWKPVQLNDVLCPGDMIRTLERSRAAIILSNESSLRLDQATTLTINIAKEKSTSLVDLLRGTVHFFSRIHRGLKVTTPFVNGFVEGTEFYVRVESDHTFLSIFEGRVSAMNEGGSLSLSKGQSALVRAGQAPVLQMVVQPRDAVQWALYYPPLLDYHPIDFPGGPENEWQARIRRSLEFYWKGDVTQAFSSLEPVLDDIRDPRFFIYQAGLLLWVGRLEEARLSIQKAASLDPGDSDVFSLNSIIAIATNQKHQAFDLAKKAVELDLESSIARVALSYAQQSLFDLQGALASLQEAVSLDPENALAWARLAELFLSFGNLDKALETAQKAVALNPLLERAQTVLGFSYLTQIKTREANQAFTC